QVHLMLMVNTITGMLSTRQNSGVYTCNATSLDQSAVTTVTTQQSLLHLVVALVTNYKLIGQILPKPVIVVTSSVRKKAPADGVYLMQTSQPVVTTPLADGQSKVVQKREWNILTSNLVNRYKDMLASDEAAFKKQFQELATSTKEIELPKTHAEKTENKKKNRYKNILPYDATRVFLKETAENPDYINANYINGYSQERKFIATQGPLDRTTGDFWRMVWEQECLVIVMLTNVVESGKTKCAKYWPDQGKRCTYDGYSVETVTEVDYGSYIVRTINIEETKNEYATVLRKVKHFHYIAWPDHGVPLITSSLIQMQKNVNAEAYSKDMKPIIVHCSAGAGRTGAYIGFDILLDEMKSKDQVNVFRTVLNMRKQRMDMVQNMKQYIFIHKLITECYALGNTEVDVAELEKHISQQPNTLANNKRIIIYQELATATEEIKLQKTHAENPEHKKKNRYKNILPYDDTRVKLKETTENSDYINANYVDGYSQERKFIATQGPLDQTTGDFWRMVWEQECLVIVMLTNPVESGKKKCAKYWPDQGKRCTYDGYNVETVTELCKNIPLIFLLVVIQVLRKIQHFHYIAWPDHGVPLITSSLVQMQGIVNAAESDSKTTVPIVVHCSDGAGRSGVFCAVNNIIKRLRAENRIDVFRTVKDLRDMRPHMVRTADQYLTCYKSISAFQSSISTYANF
uniref:protein-tyrosine-phosphatase n=1 Tax=Ciona intestinalis TaxID=7719 RepID=H2XJH7_CIOIN